MHGVLLALSLFSPARASGWGSADQLCGAVGSSAGCIQRYTPSGSPTYDSHEREPSCDEACRRRAREDYEYAIQHMVEPSPVERLGSPERRIERHFNKAVKERESQDVALAAAVLIASPAEGPPGWLVGLFAGAYLLPRLFAQYNVSLFSLDRTAAVDAPAADHPCEGVTHSLCDGLSDCNDARRATEKADACEETRIREGAGRAGDPAAKAERRYAQKAASLCREKFDAVKAEVKDRYPVHKLCDETDRSCQGVTDCETLKPLLSNAQACVTARQMVTKLCFDGAQDPLDHPGTEKLAQDVVDACQSAIDTYCK